MSSQSTQPRAWQMATTIGVFGERPCYGSHGPGRSNRCKEQSFTGLIQPSGGWHLWEQSWRRHTERSCPTLREVVFMFQVQPQTRDTLENHLTPHPLNDQLPFLPPPALSNPSPLPHSLNCCSDQTWSISIIIGTLTLETVS